MANEVTYTVAVRGIKGNIDITREVRNATVDMSGDAYSGGVQSIPTTGGGTAVTVAAAVSTPGYAWFRNLDKVNYIEIGIEDTGFFPVIRLNAGEACVLRLTDTTFHARSNTFAVLLEHIIIED